LELLPPELAVGAVAEEIVWLYISWKITLLDLNAVVLTFETLLPITSIAVWWFLRPETAEKRERIIINLPLSYLYKVFNLLL
jgi:hypothetical protein